MSGASKIIWASLVVLVGLAAVLSQFIPARQAGVQVSGYTTNAGELVSGTLVGQTFSSPQDNLSAIAVKFATYSGRANTGPIEFHLRQSIEDTTDLRTATVSPEQLGDNQAYVFSFEPIQHAKDQSFFFFVVSPTATAGSAVTVDIDTRDPYHLGTAFLVRGQGAEVTTPEVLAHSGKQTVDVSFSTYHRVPLGVAAVTQIRDAVRTFKATWHDSRATYALWLRAAIMAGIFLVVLRLMRQTTYLRLVAFFGKTRFTVLVLAGLLVLGVWLRIMYASSLPLTNDEGNYLYDAWSLRQGILAGGDGYVKAPIFIVWVAIWQTFMGNTVLAGRVSSVVVGALTAIPLYFLAKDLWSSRSVTRSWLPSYLAGVGVKDQHTRHEAGWGRRLGLITAAIWLLFGVGVVFNIYVHTQPVALFFGVSGLAVLLAALRGTVPQLTFYPSKKIPAARGWFILAGILLGLGVASRKSILALGLLPILFILLEGKTWKLIIRHFASVAVGFAIVIGLFLGFATWAYGNQGFWEAVGYNSAEDGISTDADVTPAQVRAYSLRGITPFFRESMPLVLLSLIGLGVVLEQSIYGFYPKLYVAKLGWIAPWLVFAWAWNFFFQYEGEAFMGYGIRWLWYGFAAILLLMTVLRQVGTRKRKSVKAAAETKPLVEASHQPGAVGGTQSEAIEEQQDALMSKRRLVTAAFVIPLWVGGLAEFYMHWIKFHVNYVSEFIPPLVILSAFGVVALYRRLRSHMFFGYDYPILEVLRRILVVAITLVLFWAMTVSNFITFVFEHTGTFQLGAIQEAAAWAQRNIPIGDTIFTGAAVVPYVAGYHTALDIAHPRWYAYGFTRNDPKRLNTFLPPADQMVQAFRDTQWFLLESQTGFSFIQEYSEIEKGLNDDFEAVKGIENGSNTLTFYRRVR